MKHSKRASKKARGKVVRRNTQKSSIVIISLLIIVVIFVCVATTIKVSELFTTSQKDDFPKLEIYLSSTPLEQINIDPKGTKYYNNIVTFTIDGLSQTFNNVELKGHGNFTWNLAKKPYQIKLPTKQSLFDNKKAKNWILLANYADYSYLRNDTALFLEKVLKAPYALNGNYIEVFFDDDYNGLYYLAEKIEINKSRVNLKDPSALIVEIDNIYGTECNYDLYNNCLVIKDYIDSENLAIATQSFMDILNSAESFIKSKNYEKVSELFDIDSFIKYFLLSEFTANPDAYSTSFYLYKNGEDDKIHAGPGWDFDLAFGNERWTKQNPDTTIILSPTEPMALKHFSDPTTSPYISYISTFLFDLTDLPEFNERVAKIYQQTLSGHKDELLNHIKTQAKYIRPAVLRDQDRWKSKTNFDDEISYLIDWVAKRFDYFEQTYGVHPNTGESQNANSDLAPKSPQPFQES